jgi:cytochrome c biogenesis protein CcmG, thiol:disulfide interchange protein DsbE
MLRFLFGCALMFTGLAANAAAPAKLDYLRAGSLVFSNVTVVGANATDLYFTHDKGISNVKLKYLEPELQKRFHYDPAQAAAAEKQQEHEDTRYQKEVVASLTPGPASPVATNRPISSPDAPADPISDAALIGKPGPAIEFEKWSGPKPQLKDKFALLFFWEPWSIPARKFIPQFNAYQKQFTNNLQVIGVVTREVASGASGGESPAFPNGIDSDGKFGARVGANSIPYVVLMNPKGIVLYAGHPAALNEKALQALLVRE